MSYHMDVSASTIKVQNLPSEVVEYKSFSIILIIGIVIHILLSLIFKIFPITALFHAVTMLIIGLWFLIRDDSAQRLIALTAYIAGSEVLWRMVKAPIFWEAAKYEIVILSLLGILRWGARFKFLPILYIMSLIPAALITFSDLEFAEARRNLSFNLAAPLTLSITGLFLSSRSISWNIIRRIFIWSIFPIAGIAFLAFFKTYTATEIEFGLRSNFITSGGFGPNQVSGILGLGALLCFLLLATQKNFNSLSLFVIGLMIWFLVQALLTFSRGGVANFVGATILAIPFVIDQRNNKSKLLLGLMILFLIISVSIFPLLNKFTGGYLKERFSDTSTTGRWELILLDLNLWQKNFFWGAGVGKSTTMRFELEESGIITGHYGGLAAHTEYSRLLAEHGLFGLIALFALFMMFINALRDSKSRLEKGVKLALMSWALLAMTHQAMRLAAIGYIFALGLVKFNENK